MATLNIIAAVALVGTVVATPILVIKGPVTKGPSKGVAVPGPVVGASVPAVALIGGYIWMVRRKKQRKARESTE